MPKLGETDKCSACGHKIHFTGKYWEHTDTNPRHPAFSQKQMTKDKPVNVRINRRLYDLIKKKASRLGMSFSEAVRYALTKWSEEK